MKRLTTSYLVFMFVVTPLVWLGFSLVPWDPFNGFRPDFMNWLFGAFALFWVAFNGFYWVWFVASRKERKSKKTAEQASALVKRMEQALDEKERRETGRSGDSVSQGRA